MYNPDEYLKVKDKALATLGNPAAPTKHRELASRLLKYVSQWADDGFESMGLLLADGIWRGTSTLVEVEEGLKRVNDINPEAPEFKPKAFTH